MKKEEKLPKVAALMSVGFTDNDFVEEFIRLYPHYWENIVKRYNEHERLTKPGKSHPMAEPPKYLLNVSRNYINEIRNKHSQGIIPTEEEKSELRKKIEAETLNKMMKKEKPKYLQE